MKTDGKALIIFPTEPAKRQAERRTVLQTGVAETSRMLTQRQLIARGERAARRAGRLLGRTPSEAARRLLLNEAAATTTFAPDQPLAALSAAAQADLLDRAIETLAPFAQHTPALLDWLLAHAPDHKLYGVGQLLASWRGLCSRRAIADRFVVNAALLDLIDSGELPREFNNGLCFRAVRWLNPFEELLVAALKRRLGEENVRLFSALPGTHAEIAEESLHVAVQSELMRDPSEAWNPWVEDLADAFAADDANLPCTDLQERIRLRISAHPYGEIEDAARHIAREIECGVAPDQIALVLRDLSPIADIAPDVFRRFGIPYHFRRGEPATASPAVKTLLALLTFPLTSSRDRLCDLLLSPAIQWPSLEQEERTALVQQLRQREPPRLRRPPRELQNFLFLKNFQPRTPRGLIDHAQTLIDQHALTLPDPVIRLLEEFGAVETQPVPPQRLVALLEELLGNLTLRDEQTTESGVHIINAMDASGLRFHSVYLAGLDDRTFPQIPHADAVLNATERTALRAFLNERNIPCPRLAISETSAALIQEEILFLTVLGTAAEQLTLSWAQAGSDGKERAPSCFFGRVQRLVPDTEPETGESFYPILPPEICRAEDEIRQVTAARTRRPLLPPPGLTEQTAATVQQWLDTHPELSPTALEALARNRLVFFFEKTLGIRPDRTHEDETDPADRGAVIHDILEKLFTTIAAQSGLFAHPSSKGWTLSRTGGLPLAAFPPERADELLALARTTAAEEFARSERRPSRHLGHPAVWETEKRKIVKIIENFVQMELDTASAERRYPAAFEMTFDALHQLPLTLNHGEESVRIKGKIDRIDLLFDPNGQLEQLLVVDYKSTARNEPLHQLEEKTACNLDCQLALYTFAAQQKFFGTSNSPDLNEKTAAVYHVQERDLKKMTSQFTKRRLQMTPELTSAFLETLFSNLWKLRSGDLAAEPLIERYALWETVCRTPALSPEDFLKQQSSQKNSSSRK
jgi:hypothetical protein